MGTPRAVTAKPRRRQTRGHDRCWILQDNTDQTSFYGIIDHLWVVAFYDSIEGG